MKDLIGSKIKAKFNSALVPIIFFVAFGLIILVSLICVSVFGDLGEDLPIFIGLIVFFTVFFFVLAGFLFYQVIYLTLKSNKINDDIIYRVDDNLEINNRGKIILIPLDQIIHVVPFIPNAYYQKKNYPGMGIDDNIGFLNIQYYDQSKQKLKMIQVLHVKNVFGVVSQIAPLTLPPFSYLDEDINVYLGGETASVVQDKVLVRKGRYSNRALTSLVVVAFFGAAIMLVLGIMAFKLDNSIPPDYTNAIIILVLSGFFMLLGLFAFLANYFMNIKAYKNAPQDILVLKDEHTLSAFVPKKGMVDLDINQIEALYIQPFQQTRHQQIPLQIEANASMLEVMRKNQIGIVMLKYPLDGKLKTITFKEVPNFVGVGMTIFFLKNKIISKQE